MHSIPHPRKHWTLPLLATLEIGAGGVGGNKARRHNTRELGPGCEFSNPDSGSEPLLTPGKRPAVGKEDSGPQCSFPLLGWEGVGVLGTKRVWVGWTPTPTRLLSPTSEVQAPVLIWTLPARHVLKSNLFPIFLSPPPSPQAAIAQDDTSNWTNAAE